MGKKQKTIITVILISTLNTLFSISYIYFQKNRGNLLSVQNAADSFPDKWRYLIPNLLFAFTHIFSYTHFDVVTLHVLFEFAISQMLGLILAGCAFQFLKEKTGTLWIPVLLHALFDYTSLL
ncbi:MAG: CPBP family intramembrane metalloprotease [Lachnospiraceae bacterium]|nr:CPBP family intramembrane metalloprotease [Lachnospiraceae bacterium]